MSCWLEFKLVNRKTGTDTLRASHQEKIPAPVTQHIACGLQGNQGGSPWKRVCNDIDSLNQPTTERRAASPHVRDDKVCAQTLRPHEATRSCRESQIFFPDAPIYGCHSDFKKIHGGEAHL